MTPPPLPTVVAIGNFDGVHRGHQTLLAQARDVADRLGVLLTVVTFEPHPRQLFQPGSAPLRITPFPVKERALLRYSVDRVVALPFSAELAALSAESFLRDVLIGQLNAVHVVVGADFRYGKDRAGTVETLRAAGMAVTPVALAAEPDGAVISSSRVRAALSRGDLPEARRLMGWAWEFQGVVQHGDKRGRELGYPTANLPMRDILHPAWGIYAARVRIEGEDAPEQWRPAALSLGIRPMFALKEALAEVYLLDFSGDLYGKTLVVQPVAFLRPEARFETLDALIRQMDEDCRLTREILAASA